MSQPSVAGPRLIRAVVSVLLGLLSLVAIAGLLVESTWGKNWLRRKVIAEATQFLNGDLEIATVSGPLLTGVTLRGVTLRQHDVGVVHLEAIALAYNPIALATGGHVLRQLVLTRPTVRVTQDAQGWAIGRLLKPRPTVAPSNTRFAISDVRVEDGTIDIEGYHAQPRRLTHVQLQGALEFAGPDWRVRLGDVTLRDDRAHVEVLQLSGIAAVRQDSAVLDRLVLETATSHVKGHASVLHYATRPAVDVALDASPIALGEVGQYVPALAGQTLVPTLSIVASGPLDHLSVKASMRSTAGNAAGQFAGDLWNVAKVLDGTLSVDGLNAAPILQRSDLVSDVTGSATLHLALPPSGTLQQSTASFELNAPHVAAAGYVASTVHAMGRFAEGILSARGSGAAYGATATGRVEWHSAAAQRSPGLATASGHVWNLNLRQLPRQLAVPRLDSRVSASFEARRSGTNQTVSLVFDDSVVEDADVASGTTASIGVTAAGLTHYAGRGSVRHLDAARIGRAADITALQGDRYKSDVNASFTVNGCGHTLAELDGTLEATVTDSTVGLTKIPHLHSEGTVAGRRLTAALDGQVAGLDPYTLGVGASAAFTLNGSMTAHVTNLDVGAPLDLHALTGDAQVQLQHSTLAGVEVDIANIDATVDGGLATVRQIDIEGPVLSARASGDVALGDRGASNLKYVLDARDLEALGKALGQPLHGSAHTVGTLTGSAGTFVATGTLAALQPAYADTVSALALTTTYVVTLPNRQVDRLSANATSEAAFVKIGGTDIARIQATTKYEARQLDVDARIDQKDRTVQLAGVVELTPERDEVHLRQMSIGAKGALWTLAPGTDPQLAYGHGQLSIRDVTLERPGQQIRLAGALSGSAGGAAEGGLTVHADRVQVADLNAMLLGQHKLAGQLDGTVTVTGTWASPRMDADLTVTNGQVEAATFEAATLQAQLRDGRVAVTFTLDQTATNHLTARGTVPLSAISPSANIVGEGMDLRVDSTPIDLGFAQLFTTEVSQVHGTGQVSLHVTGAWPHPALTGDITLAALGFQAAATGTTFGNGRAALHLDGNRLAINALSIEDDDGHAMTADGALDVFAGTGAQAVDLHIATRNLHVLNSKVGLLQLDADLRAAGELFKPHVTGTIQVKQGRLEIDQILPRVTSSAYATTALAGPAEAAKTAPSARAVGPGATNVAPIGGRPSAAAPTGAPAPGAPPAPSGPPPPGLFDDATLAISVTVPSNLVVRGRDMRTESGSLGIGDMNVTLGGTIDVQKAAGQSTTLVGQIEVVRGYYQFQGRRFDIVRGSEIRFQGAPPINPTLNITASRDISGVTVEVRLLATMNRPRLELSSAPPLDQSDILSLIVFNQPINDLGASQRISIGQRAGTLAAGMVANPVSDAVARALNLDQFEIQPPGGDSAAGSVAVARQVGDRVFIGLKQNFGASEASVLSFEYHFSEALRLVTSVAQGTQESHGGKRVDPGGVDIIYVIRR